MAPSRLHSTPVSWPGPTSASKENTLTLHVSDTDAIEVNDVFVGDLSHHAGCLKEGLWEKGAKEGQRQPPRVRSQRGSAEKETSGSQESPQLSAKSYKPFP